MFRPAVLGYADAYDVVTLVAGIEDTLRELGQAVDYGQGVGVALRVLAEG